MLSYQTVNESRHTLEKQVFYLERGTNPVVFFPSHASFIPQLPNGMKSIKREMGTFYFNPKFLNEGVIDAAIEKNSIWALLGFAQDKKEVLKTGSIIAIVARDTEGKEVKTAIISSGNENVASFQAYIFYHWFPGCVVKAETVFDVLAERLIDNGVINA